MESKDWEGLLFIGPKTENPLTTPIRALKNYSLPWKRWDIPIRMGRITRDITSLPEMENRWYYKITLWMLLRSLQATLSTTHGLSTMRRMGCITGISTVRFMRDQKGPLRSRILFSSIALWDIMPLQIIWILMYIQVNMGIILPMAKQFP